MEGGSGSHGCPDLPGIVERIAFDSKASKEKP
jgi:hypothetical protein